MGDQSVDDKSISSSVDDADGSVKFEKRRWEALARIIERTMPASLRSSDEDFEKRWNAVYRHTETGPPSLLRIEGRRFKSSPTVKLISTMAKGISAFASRMSAKNMPLDADVKERLIQPESDQEERYSTENDISFREGTNVRESPVISQRRQQVSFDEGRAVRARDSGRS